MERQMGSSTKTRAEIMSRLGALIDDRTTLLRLPDLRRTRDALIAAGLEPLLREVTSSGAATDVAAQTLEWVWLNSIIERIEFVEPALTSFDADGCAVL